MRKLILRQFQTPSDAVMLTAAVRDLHTQYPEDFSIDVRSPHSHIWENNPYITKLSEADRDVQIIDCQWPLNGRDNGICHHRIERLLQMLSHSLGIKIELTAFRGDIHLSDIERSWSSQVGEIVGREIPFWIVVTGGSYDMTVKWWHPRRFQEVVEYFRDKIIFVQVGCSNHYHPALKGVIDLRGATGLRQLIRLMYHSQGVLCPVTLTMHLASAVPVKGGSSGDRPCVVVAGGRESPHWQMYPQHQFIHTIGSISCCGYGGCWRSRVTALEPVLNFYQKGFRASA
jgi:ADP-heptose:LPS heptosyltransferase